MTLFKWMGLCLLAGAAACASAAKDSGCGECPAPRQCMSYGGIKGVAHACLLPCTSDDDCPANQCCKAGWAVDDGPSDVCMDRALKMCGSDPK